MEQKKKKEKKPDNLNGAVDSPSKLKAQIEQFLISRVALDETLLSTMLNHCYYLGNLFPKARIEDKFSEGSCDFVICWNFGSHSDLNHSEEDK